MELSIWVKSPDNSSKPFLSTSLAGGCINRALRNVKVEHKVASTHHEFHSYFKVKLVLGGTCQTLHQMFLDFSGV